MNTTSGIVRTRVSTSSTPIVLRSSGPSPGEPGRARAARVGIVLNSKGAVDNNHSGPDGVASHGRWLYAGDGDSTLKVIDLNIAGPNAIVQSVGTAARRGSTRWR